jgi:hypothetical protein
MERHVFSPCRAPAQPPTVHRWLRLHPASRRIARTNGRRQESGHVSACGVSASDRSAPRALDLATGERDRSCPACGGTQDQCERADGLRGLRAEVGATLPGVVRSLHEGGDELLTFFEFPKVQWKTLRTTNVIERLHEEFRRRVKPQGSLPTEDAALVLLFGLIVSGQTGCAGSTGGVRSRQCSASDASRRHDASHGGGRRPKSKSRRRGHPRGEFPELGVFSWLRLFGKPDGSLPGRGAYRLTLRTRSRYRTSVFSGSRRGE